MFVVSWLLHLLTSNALNWKIGLYFNPASQPHSQQPLLISSLMVCHVTKCQAVIHNFVFLLQKHHHEHTAPCTERPHYQPASSGRYILYTQFTDAQGIVCSETHPNQTIWNPFPQLSVNIRSFCSASTEVLLWTQTMNSTARWRRPVSSRGQELWGEMFAFDESVVSGDFQNCLDGLSSIVLSSAFSHCCPVGLRSPKSL